MVWGPVTSIVDGLLSPPATAAVNEPQSWLAEASPRSTALRHLFQDKEITSDQSCRTVHLYPPETTSLLKKAGGSG